MSRPADPGTPAVPVPPAVSVARAGLSVARTPLAVAPLAAVRRGGGAVRAGGALGALSEGDQHQWEEEQWDHLLASNTAMLARREDNSGK